MYIHVGVHSNKFPVHIIHLLVVSQVCEVLLKNGAEMNEADNKYGWTAVMLAIQNKYAFPFPIPVWE